MGEGFPDQHTAPVWLCGTPATLTPDASTCVMGCTLNALHGIQVCKPHKNNIFTHMHICTCSNTVTHTHTVPHSQGRREGVGHGRDRSFIIVTAATLGGLPRHTTRGVPDSASSTVTHTYLCVFVCPLPCVYLCVHASRCASTSSPRAAVCAAEVGPGVCVSGRGLQRREGMLAHYKWKWSRGLEGCF